jgi:DNA repair protein RadC
MKKKQLTPLAGKRLKQYKLATIKTGITLPDMEISNHGDAVKVLREIMAQDSEADIVENFYVLHLNRSGKLIGYSYVGKGGLSAVIADPRIIVLELLQSLATSAIVCHNHPSGSLKPSNADIQLTEKLKTALVYFDMRLLDHVIITEESSYSMAAEGDL